MGPPHRWWACTRCTAADVVVVEDAQVAEAGSGRLPVADAAGHHPSGRGPDGAGGRLRAGAAGRPGRRRGGRGPRRSARRGGGRGAAHGGDDAGASAPSASSAWVGPHVCGACYEVPDAMREEVAAVVPETYADHGMGDTGAGSRGGCARPARGGGGAGRRRWTGAPARTGTCSPTAGRGGPPDGWPGWCGCARDRPPACRAVGEPAAGAGADRGRVQGGAAGIPTRSP